MKNKEWLFLLFFIIHGAAYARTVTCSGGAAPISVTLPTSVAEAAIKITASRSGDMSNYRDLYTWDVMHFGSSNTECAASENGATLGWMEYAYSISGKAPINHGGNYIFPTEIDGIGISFRDADTSSGAIGSYTGGALKRATWTLSAAKTQWNALFKVSVTLWKIPGKFNPSQFNSSGVLEFNDIKIVQALQITSAGDTWSSSQPDWGQSLLSNSWTTNEVRLKGGTNLYPGTCNFANQQVNMGKHQVNEIPVSGPWKDIIFTVSCTPAWGFRGEATMSGTTANEIISKTAHTANRGIILIVYDRTGIEDASRGIIKLKSGGAQGYGIQLAWGTAASQPTSGDPAQMVVFNQSKAISTTNYGFVGRTPTQLVNMAARYIRTTGTATGGLADGAIEIVASYN